MAIDVELSADPASVLARASDFLGSDPVRHNVILTLLRDRAANPAEGRYLIAADGDDVVGVVFQSPLTFIATITPMDEPVIEACVDVLAREAVGLPGVSGEAASAAIFAGQWTECTKSAAVPEQGQRIYEAGPISEPVSVRGDMRCAEAADRPLLVQWPRGFHADTQEPLDDPVPTVNRRVAARQFWVWDDGRPVSMAALTSPVAGVARVQAVYTPPEERNRGYASACVARLSSITLAAGTRCILYTDLGNPVSNSVYRRIGYHVSAEVLRYRFA